MRQQIPLFAAALLLACAVPATGQNSDFEVSAFVAPGGSYSDHNGFHFDAGLGASVGWRFGSRWAAQGRFLQSSADFADIESFQLGLRYAFLDAAARWRPFVISSSRR